MIKISKVFAKYVASKFVQPNMQLNAYKAYRFQVNYAIPKKDYGELALHLLQVDGYLPDIDLKAETVAWKAYLTSYKLEAEKTSLEYRVIQLEQDMAKLKSEVGISKSSMSELGRRVGIYMGK